jgi:hypothetical protein
MTDTRAYLLNDSTSPLVEALMKRVIFWPTFDESEYESAKQDFASMLVERYLEILGSNKVIEITETSRTENEMLEAILWEIEQREATEDEDDLKTSSNRT